MMRNTKKGFALRVVAFIALMAILGIGYSAYSRYLEIDRAVRQSASRAQSAMHALSKLTQSISKTEKETFLDDATAGIMSTALTPIVEHLRDGAIRRYDSGWVIRVDADGLVLPEGVRLPESVNLSPASFVDESGNRLDGGNVEANPDDDSKYGCSFARIWGDYYFIRLPDVDYEDYCSTAGTLLKDYMNDIDTAFDGHVLECRLRDGKHYLVYAPDRFSDYETCEDMGIPVEASKNALRTVVIDGNAFGCLGPLPLSDRRDESIVFLVPMEQIYANISSRFGALMIVSALILSIVLVWRSAAASASPDEATRQDGARRHIPRRILRTLLCLGLCGAIVVGLTSMLTDALLNLRSATDSNASSLSILESLLERRKADDEQSRKRHVQANTRYVQLIGDLLTQYPQLQTPQMLDALCKVIDADYLMVYDHTGAERLTNVRYTDFTLPEDKKAASYPFRRLLTGVETMVRESVQDENTGLERDMIGASIGSADSGYEALLAAFEPYIPDTETQISDTMTMITTKETLSFSVDPVKSVVVDSSIGYLRGNDPLKLGLTQEKLRDEFLDFFVMYNQRWYGKSDEKDGLLYYYAIQEKSLFTDIFLHAAAFMGMFLLVYALLAVAMSASHGRASETVRVNEDREVTIGRLSSENAALKSLRQWWVEKEPADKALTVLQLEIDICIIVLIFSMNYDVFNIGRFNIFAHVLNGQWQPGFNLFALMKILVSIAYVLLAIMPVRIISAMLDAAFVGRAKTLSRFAFSLLQYLAALLVMYFSMTYLGLDIIGVTTVIAGMTVAITFLANNLVADALSGIGIALSNYYQIDDYVEIKEGMVGFRGWVKDIGLRNTTLVNEQGDVKVFANRDIKNVLNLSRGICRYVLQLTIGFDQPLDKIEALLDKELPEIGKRVPNIVIGPSYKGIVAIDKGTMTLNIVVECREPHYGQVRADVNREIHRLFTENGITIQ